MNPSQAPTPIYQLIEAALDESVHLPRDFSLPDHTPDNRARFAPGAMDGIGIYHMMPQDMSEQAASVADWVRRACKGLDPDLLHEIAALLDQHRVLHLADGLLTGIRDDHGDITPGEVYTLAVRLMTESTHVETVKLGIIISGLLDLSGNPAFRNMVLTLGRYDEFTLYVLVAVGSWPDADDLIFDFAQSVHGWGKIHAVERLNPTSEVIRSWIIAGGCQNDVVDAYLARTCAQKGDLVGHLSRTKVTDALFDGAGVILTALLDEGPVAGISAYPEAEAAIGHYLRHAEARQDLDTLWVILSLRDWLEGCDLPTRETLLERCAAMAAAPHWPPLIFHAVETGSRDELWRASTLADGLGLDIAAGLMKRLPEDPVGLGHLAGTLMQKPGCIDAVLALYGEVLPLGDIATGMGDLMGLGPEYRHHSCLDALLQNLGGFPGRGLDLIRAGLGSPVVRNRNTALRTLGAWTETGADLESFDPALPGLLRELHEREVNDSTKATLAGLLGI